MRRPGTSKWRSARVTRQFKVMPSVAQDGTIRRGWFASSKSSGLALSASARPPGSKRRTGLDKDFRVPNVIDGGWHDASGPLATGAACYFRALGFLGEILA